MLPTTEEYETPCSTTQDQRMWFSNRQADVNRCKQFCRGCKILLACRASAISYERLSGTEMTGTQGGLSRDERRKIVSMTPIA